MSDVSGKDLIEMGFAPAPWFGEALREITERRLSLSQAARIAQGYVDRIAAAEAARAARERPLHATPPDWRLNITSESEARFGLANVVDEIRPHGAIMAGDWEADAPWRRKRGSE
ncbi:hypothetical protein IQ03_01353 [Gemmobacter caeni]|uniref:Uncharacterized protein n=1 Tax=Gemmobacter caeni TaxID=589035 RepID=A0A2T6B8K8_9RHOB|nr:hypothetical protein [Gemmobacter caeni]PTX52394.1 hypothetical protein C8N34_102173 [Gemmobacter caeni]TWJ02934.1 hypothetical protein IQ03_01353 [Gemmobacter caeni]